MKFWILFGLFLVTHSVIAAEFFLSGKAISSKVDEKIIACDGYSISLISESFPMEYELSVPEEYRIEGFNGSRAYIRREAFIEPFGIKVPKPQEIDSLKNFYKAGLTYLPTNAVCRDNEMIISYWSGGNCSHCEAFIHFTLENKKLISPVKVSYRDVKAMRNQ